MDTIDVSNLNRQFLFRPKDVGKSKAKTAAAFIMERVPSVTVIPHHCSIQSLSDEFYRSFQIVVCGLDSVEARRWINATLVSLVDSDMTSVIPLIDGGTEGFKGQSRVIIPTISSCYECSLDMLTPPTTFPICTIQNTPRLPEHCIEWASVLEWPRLMDDKLDGDNGDHIKWLYEKAKTRADDFGIQGVTIQLTQGVVKRIIPAIASTNAIIAASCCNEAFKIATSCQPYLENYMMYAGNEGIYTYTFKHEKRPDCPVCGADARVVKVRKDTTVQEWIEQLQEDRNISLKRPSLRTVGGKAVYMQAPPQLELQTRENLDKTVYDVIGNDQVLVTDSNLPLSLQLIIEYEQDE